MEGGVGENPKTYNNEKAGPLYINIMQYSWVSTTEYTELQPLLSGVHSVMRVKLVLAGEGAGCTPTPSLYIYHHQ
jgi:hypothetical protein